MELTKEQERFLAACELEFADRFSVKDAAFIELKDRSLSSPPIVEPWGNHGGDRYPRGGGYRNHQRGRGRDRNWRDDRSSGGSSSHRDDSRESYSSRNNSGDRHHDHRDHSSHHYGSHRSRYEPY